MNVIPLINVYQRSRFVSTKIRLITSKTLLMSVTTFTDSCQFDLKSYQMSKLGYGKRIINKQTGIGYHPKKQPFLYGKSQNFITREVFIIKPPNAVFRKKNIPN